MKTLVRFLAVIILITLPFSVVKLYKLGFTPDVFAQTPPAGDPGSPTPQCVGDELGQYVSDVFDDLGGGYEYGDVKLLSPAFNMTNPNFGALVSNFSSSLSSRGYNFNSFFAVAGNAYYFPDANIPISAWISAARGTAIGNKSIILTETGWYPPATRSDAVVAETGNQLKGGASIFGQGVIGALMFNVFGNNGDATFEGHVMNAPSGGPYTLTDIQQQICKGNCSGIGANSASFYSQPSNTFYGKAGAIGMTYTLEIGNDDSNRNFPSLLPGLLAANANGATPIIRLGVQDAGGGFEPSAGGPVALSRFIKDLDALVDFPVYVIVGSNEPLTECWATPSCGCTTGDDQDKVVKFTGKVFSNRTLIDPRTNAERSGTPVRGAVVCTYEGTWDFDAGSEGGKIGKLDCDTTDGNGEYEVYGLQRAFGETFDRSNFLAYYDGYGKYMDMYKIGFDNDRVENGVRKNVYLPFGSNNYESPPAPPDKIDLRQGTERLTCEAGSIIDSQESYGVSKIGIGTNSPVKLLDKDQDDFFIGGAPPGEQSEEASRVLVGNSGISDVHASPTTAFINWIGSYGTGASDEITPIREGETFEDKLPSCETIRRANQTLSDDVSEDPDQINSHKAYGMVVKLTGPGVWEGFYERALSIDPPICKDEGDSVVFLSDIEPPYGFSDDSQSAVLGAKSQRARAQNPDGELDPNVLAAFSLDSSYFPYARIFGDPTIVSQGAAETQAVNDSARPVVDPTEADRQTGFDAGPETPFVTYDATRLFSGVAEFSNEILCTLASDTCSYDDTGSGPIFALLNDPFVPFGYSSEGINPYASGSSSLSQLKSGGERGDFRIGKTFQLCSCNVNDNGCNEPLNDFTGSDADEAREGSFNLAYEYITNKANIVEQLREWITKLFGVEEVDWNAYEKVFTSVTAGFDIWDDNIVPGGTCAPVVWENSGACDPAEPECRVASCSISGPGCGGPSTPSGCSCDDYGGADAVCGPNPPTLPAGFSALCSYQTAQLGGYGEDSSPPPPECLGDLRGGYEGKSDSFNDPTFDKVLLAAKNIALAVGAQPFEEYDDVGAFKLIDHPITNAEDRAQRDTQAYNSGQRQGHSSTQWFDTYLGQAPFSDPKFSSKLGKPDLGAPLPGGTSGGNGTCDVAPEGSPCAVSRLINYFPTQEAAEAASMICMAESGAFVKSMNSACLEGETPDYSVGLFQINLLVPGRCPGGDGVEFTDPPMCQITDPDVLQDCVEHFWDVDNDGEESILWAVANSAGGTNWGKWSTAAVCGL